MKIILEKLIQWLVHIIMQTRFQFANYYTKGKKKQKPLVPRVSLCENWARKELVAPMVKALTVDSCTYDL